MNAARLAALAGLVLTAGARAQAPPDSTVDSTVAGRLSQIFGSGVPGLLATPLPGTTAGGSRIRIRGSQTLIDRRVPLVLVDGIPIDVAASALGFQGSVTGMPRLDDFGATDVARITVIPGPAAAGQYGPDAANGVVLIETHPGALGAGVTRWDVSIGAALRSRFDNWPTYVAGIDTDNPQSAYRNGNCQVSGQATGACALDSTRAFSPDIARRQFQDDWRQEYGLQVRGGGAKAGYYVSANVESMEGALRMAGPEAARLNALGDAPEASVLRPDAIKRWRLRANLALRPIDNLEIHLRGQRFRVEQRVLPLEPLVVASRGECCSPNVDSVATSFAQLFHAVHEEELGRWIGSVQARWRALPSLTFRADVGVDAPDQNGRSTRPGTVVVLNEDAFESRTFSSQVAAEYDAPLWPEFNWHVVAGVQQIAHRGRHFGRLEIGSPPAAYLDSTLYDRHRETGFFLSQRLVYHDALEITAGIRHDVLQVFGGAAPSATHPSVAVAWAARQPASPSGPSLRLRAGYGSAGRWPLGADQDQERTAEATAGVDGTAFGNRLTLSATVYDMRSQVNPTPISPFFPFYGALRLGGEIQNRGVEIALGGQIAATPAFGLDVHLTMWGNRNRLRSLDGAPYRFGPAGSDIQGMVPGYPVGVYFTVPIISYADANGDGMLAQNEVVLGDPVPTASPYPTHGAALSLGWRVGRWFHLGSTVEYRGGNHLINWSEYMRCISRCRESVDPTRPLADQAQVVSNQVTARFLEDADFLKLRSLSVTIEPPRKVLRFLRANAAAFTVTGRNLLTWTRYSYGDPETLIPEPAVGSPESITGRFMVPPPPEWSLLVRLTY